MEISELTSQQPSERSARESKVIMKALKDYIAQQQYQYLNMSITRARESLLSELNYQMRSQLRSCRSFGLTICPGDICFIDFGRAYLQEAGFQHFGLVLNVFNGKAFVVPMTSNFDAYRQAYDPVYNPEGLTHLMRLGKIDGLYKYSVLFLNDGKFINMARIIDIKAHIDTGSVLFRQIRERAVSCIQQTG